MAITTLDDYISSAKQRLRITKTTARTTVAAIPFTVFDLTTGAGTLAGSNAANGVVPTDVTTGFPSIAFSTGVGYLSKVEFGGSVAARVSLFDMLFKAGTYAYTAGTSNLASQPAISSRCPDYPGSGTVFGKGNEIWIEVSTAFATGNAWTIQVTYTNDQGTTGRTSIVSPALAAAALTIGKMFQLSLQAGDTGVQTIESVIVTNPVTAMTAGAVNVLILRPLWTSGRIKAANDGDIHDMLKTGLPIVYSDSAIMAQIAADGVSSGVFEVAFEIASK